VEAPLGGNKRRIEEFFPSGAPKEGAIINEILEEWVQKASFLRFFPKGRAPSKTRPNNPNLFLMGN